MMASYNKRQRRQFNRQATSAPVPPVPAIKTPKKFDFTTPQARSEFGRQQAAPKQSALRPQILKNIQGQLAAGGPDPVVAAQRAAFEQDVGKERKQLVENLQRYGVLGGGASAGATADVLGEFAGQTNIGRLQLGAQEALRRDQALDRAMAFEQANRAAAAQEAGMVGNLGGVQTLAAQQMEAQQGLAQGDLDLRRQALAAEFGIRGSDAAIREAMATEDLLRSGQERGQGRTLFGERVTAGQQFGLQERGQDLAEAALTGQLDDVQTLAASQQAAQQRLAEAGLTGQLDGQRTLAGAESERARRQQTEDLARALQQRQIEGTLFRERVGERERFAGDESLRRAQTGLVGQQAAALTDQRAREAALHRERVSEADRFALEEAASRRAGDLTREQLAGMLAERQLLPGRAALEEDVARGDLALRERADRRAGRAQTEELAGSVQERQMRQATFDERVRERERFDQEQRAQNAAIALQREQQAGMLAERQLLPGRAKLEEDVARGQLGIAEAGSSREGRRLTQDIANQVQQRQIAEALFRERVTDADRFALEEAAGRRAGRQQVQDIADQVQQRQMRQATFDERVSDRDRFALEEAASRRAGDLTREQLAGMLAERQLMPERFALEEDVARGQLGIAETESSREGRRLAEDLARSQQERQIRQATFDERVSEADRFALEERADRRAGDLTREQIAGMLTERQLMPGRAELEEDVARGQLALQQAEGRRAGDLTREQIAGMLAERQLMPGRAALEEDIARGQLAIGQGQLALGQGELDLQGELGREGMRQEGLRRTDARRAVLEQAQLERERMRQQDRQFGEEGRRADRALTEDLARSVQDRQIAAALHRERVTDADRFELEGDVARAGMGLTAQQAAALEDERAIRSALHRERVTDRERFTEDQKAGRRAQQALTEDLAGSLQRRQIEGKLFEERVGERERFEQERDLAAAGLTGRLGEDDTLQRQALEAELTGRYGDEETIEAKRMRQAHDLDILGRELSAREARAGGGDIGNIIPALRQTIEDPSMRGILDPVREGERVQDLLSVGNLTTEETAQLQEYQTRVDRESNLMTANDWRNYNQLVAKQGLGELTRTEQAELAQYGAMMRTAEGEQMSADDWERYNYLVNRLKSSGEDTSAFSHNTQSAIG
tara:strand:+ start:1691 stop:5131 length:3441 start_codon:yes stop_codon:yes gene_type:complete